MSSQRSILSRMRRVIKTVFNRQETPRDMQERQDLYMSILSATHRSMRLQHRIGYGGVETREQVEKLIDAAVEKLEESDAATTPIVGLRYELQNILAPEIISTFEAFRKVDQTIPTAADASEDITAFSDDNEKFQSTLTKELEIIKAQLGSDPVDSPSLRDNSKPASNTPNPIPFLTTKRGALETVLMSKGWAVDLNVDLNVDLSSIATSNTGDVVNEGNDEWTPDSFGYYAENADDDVNAAIRHYQMINIVKSALIREQLGFSILSLKSTVPLAGRGVFVDGTALAGSLIAFFPGQIWPKEYLSNAAFSTSIFKDDNNYQLSIRYDDVLIDSRKSPYTVLNDSNSNPWALGHIVNHPPKGMTPNCRTVMINFTEKMKLEKSGFGRYVPNTYAREPMLTGGKAFDRDLIDMHGFALMAVRDVSNEELFYDYRLSPGSSTGLSTYPSWYYPCDEESLKNRWWQEELT